MGNSANVAPSPSRPISSMAVSTRSALLMQGSLDIEHLSCGVRPNLDFQAAWSETRYAELKPADAGRDTARSTIGSRDSPHSGQARLIAEEPARPNRDQRTNLTAATLHCGPFGYIRAGTNCRLVGRADVPARELFDAVHHDRGKAVSSGGMQTLDLSPETKKSSKPGGFRHSDPSSSDAKSRAERGRARLSAFPATWVPCSPRAGAVAALGGSEGCPFPCIVFIALNDMQGL